MARCIFHGAKWWTRPGFAALAGACYTQRRPAAAEGKPLDDKSAANLRPYHLSTWQEAQGGHFFTQVAWCRQVWCENDR